MRCGSCGTENEVSRKFCGECGGALVSAPEAPSSVSWAATESPFVFRHGGAYWLSITYTGGDAREPAARLYARAPEYLHDPDTGRWWITSCGWPGEPFQPVILGSVAIRPLDWA